MRGRRTGLEASSLSPAGGPGNEDRDPQHVGAQCQALCVHGGQDHMLWPIWADDFGRWPCRPLMGARPCKCILWIYGSCCSSLSGPRRSLTTRWSALRGPAMVSARCYYTVMRPRVAMFYVRSSACSSLSIP